MPRCARELEARQPFSPLTLDFRHVTILLRLLLPVSTFIRHMGDISSRRVCRWVMAAPAHRTPPAHHHPIFPLRHALIVNTRLKLYRLNCPQLLLYRYNARRHRHDDAYWWCRFRDSRYLMPRWRKFTLHLNAGSPQESSRQVNCHAQKFFRHLTKIEPRVNTLGHLYHEIPADILIFDVWYWDDLLWHFAIE